VIRLRASTVEDVRAVAAWIRTEADLRTWSGSTFRWPLEVEQLRAYVTEAPDRHRLMWTAVPDPEAPRPDQPRPDRVVLGHASLALTPDGTAGRLGRILVDPDRRGRGLGRAMVTSAVAAAFAQTRIAALTLGVYRQNTAARRLYEGLGFTTTAVLEGVTTVGDEAWDAIEMALPRDRFALAD